MPVSISCLKNAYISSTSYNLFFTSFYKHLFIAFTTAASGTTGAAELSPGALVACIAWDDSWLFSTLGGPFSFLFCTILFPRFAGCFGAGLIALLPWVEFFCFCAELPRLPCEDALVLVVLFWLELAESNLAFLKRAGVALPAFSFGALHYFRESSVGVNGPYSCLSSKESSYSFPFLS